MPHGSPHGFRSRRSRLYEARRRRARSGTLAAVQGSEDLLEEIGLSTCDPLMPAAACTLAVCSRGLNKVMRAPLLALRSWYEEARKLGHKVGASGAKLRRATRLGWSNQFWHQSRLATVAHMRTLGTLISSCMPAVELLNLAGNRLGDDGVRALCAGLGRGSALRLAYLYLDDNGIGLEGASCLATTLGRGPLPKLQILGLRGNRLGSRGLAALAAPLRRHPALEYLYLDNNNIEDEGVVALVSGAPGERPPTLALRTLYLMANPLTDAGSAPG